MRYSANEVRGLIEGYAELRERKRTSGAGLHILCLLADLDRAIYHMPPKEYQAVLLYGQLGHTIRDAEESLGVSKSTLHRRYESGIAWIVQYLNTGEE